MLARLPVRRKGAELFPVRVLLLLFLGRIWPENGTLWESLWEPPGPRPLRENKLHQIRGSNIHSIMNPCSNSHFGATTKEHLCHELQVTN